MPEGAQWTNASVLALAGDGDPVEAMVRMDSNVERARRV
jgi:hypothetical protein